MKFLPHWFKYAVRRLLHFAVVEMLRRRSVPYQFNETGCCLIIAPHPDDEALGCGGLILHKREKFLPVHIVYITDGSASHPGHPELSPGDLADIRKREARAAMQFLGVEESALHFLDFPDGTLARPSAGDAATLTNRLASLIGSLDPAEIFLPFRHDGSCEHDAAFVHVEKALGMLSRRPLVREYPVWSWWNPLLTLEPARRSRTVYRLALGDRRGRKRAALELYRSQTQATPPWTSPMLSPQFLSFFSGGNEFYYHF